MKKIIATLAVAAAAVSYVHAQGTIAINNGNASYLITTNNGSAGSLTASGNSGVTVKTANSYYYALLVASYGGSVPSSNPLNAAWSGAVLTGVNFGVTAGGVQGQGGATGAATPAGTWGAPIDGTPTSGAEKYYILVGWSANLGTTWATVSSELASGWSGFQTGQGVFGTSAIGYGYSGGGPFSLNAPSIWGVTASEPGGLTSGFTLNGIVPVPEPTSIALAGLGGLALLAFRRKKA